MKKSKITPIFISAFKSLSVEIRVLLAISFSSVLLIELILKDVPAPNNTIFRLGEIYLRVAYAFTTSILFYYINVQYPKEIKKVKSSLLIANPLSIIHNTLQRINSTLFKYQSLRDHYSGEKRLTEEMYQEAYNQIDMKKPVYTWGVQDQQILLHGGMTWWEFFTMNLDKVEKIIKTELYPISDLVDVEILSKYRMISDLINQLEYHTADSNMSITDNDGHRIIKYIPHMLQSLTEMSDDINRKFRKKHLETWHQYTFMFHKSKT